MSLEPENATVNLDKHASLKSSRKQSLMNAQELLEPSSDAFRKFELPKENNDLNDIS